METFFAFQAISSVLNGNSRNRLALAEATVFKEEPLHLNEE